MKGILAIMACSMLVAGGITANIANFNKTTDVLSPPLPTNFFPSDLQWSTEQVDNAAHYKYYQNDN